MLKRRLLTFFLRQLVKTYCLEYRCQQSLILLHSNVFQIGQQSVRKLELYSMYFLTHSQQSVRKLCSFHYRSVRLRSDTWHNEQA